MNDQLGGVLLQVFLSLYCSDPSSLCRKGCKHYDSVGEQKSAEFRDFYWMEKEFSDRT